MRSFRERKKIEKFTNLSINTNTNTNTNTVTRTNIYRNIENSIRCIVIFKRKQGRRYQVLREIQQTLKFY